LLIRPSLKLPETKLMMDANYISERLSSMRQEMSDLRVTTARYWSKNQHTALDKSAHALGQGRLLQIKRELSDMMKRCAWISVGSGTTTSNPLPADASNILTKAAIPMTRDSRKTWQYFAQAVIQEEDPVKLTYLMQGLYRVLKDDGKQPTRTFWGSHGGI
jgi:hypothetical protein